MEIQCPKSEVGDPLYGHRVGDLTLHSYEIDGVVVDVRLAWALEGIDFDAPVSVLEHVLDEDSWDGGKPRNLALRFPHWDLILEADLSAPVIVTLEEGCRYLTVVDGRHRVVKAWLLGEETIPARYVDAGVLLESARAADKYQHHLCWTV